MIVPVIVILVEYMIKKHPTGKKTTKPTASKKTTLIEGILCFAGKKRNPIRNGAERSSFSIDLAFCAGERSRTEAERSRTEQLRERIAEFPRAREQERSGTERVRRIA